MFFSFLLPFLLSIPLFPLCGEYLRQTEGPKTIRLGTIFAGCSGRIHLTHSSAQSPSSQISTRRDTTTAATSSRPYHTQQRIPKKKKKATTVQTTPSIQQNKNKQKENECSIVCVFYGGIVLPLVRRRPHDRLCRDCPQGSTGAERREREMDVPSQIAVRTFFFLGDFLFIFFWMMMMMCTFCIQNWKHNMVGSVLQHTEI